MNWTGWIVVATIIVVAIIVLVAWIGLRRRRLQSRFGPEYRQVASERGSKWRADSELAERQQRRQKLDIRPLSQEAASRYANAWQGVQAEFVDQPYQAVTRADQLVGAVMREKGYPMENFEQNASDISVDYPELVGNYRSAHSIATKQKSANTEELRTAMLHYRALFQSLLGEQRDDQGPRPNAEARERQEARSADPASAPTEGRR